ncbi:MAG: hypothetical protein JW959_08590 [Pirellulales bacterium]|nr:hypothetical protein [Pirellulales bacterium]
MCFGIAIPVSDLPEELVEQRSDRVAARGPGELRELRFTFRDPRPELPLWHGNRLVIYPWGNRDGRVRLPRTGWCRRESLEAGLWSHLRPEAVDIPAAFGLEKGVWFLIEEGIRGILVRDERGGPHAYMLTQPASHYYRIMTRHPRMPVFLGWQI